jgi:hypothetical protein
MSEKPNGWQSGQRAVIDRQRNVTIDRVTPSGRAVVGKQTFDPGGYEITTTGDRWRRPKLEALTPEIEAEMALVIRERLAWSAANMALLDADRWLRNAASVWAHPVPEAADVDTAERLTAAIRQAMGADDAR